MKCRYLKKEFRENQTPGAWRAGPYATHIENICISWISKFVGYKTNMGELPNGIFTNGGSAANLMGIDLGRHQMISEMGESKSDRMIYYSSQNAHFSIDRSLSIMGIRKEQSRKIRSHLDGRMDVVHL